MLVVALSSIVIAIVNAFIPSEPLYPYHPFHFTADKISMIAATTSTNTESETLELVHRYDSPFFPDDEASSDIRHPTHATLILLNTPIQNSDPRIGELSGALSVLWQKSCYRICADGGANRLYQATVNSDDYNDTATCNEYLPDLITGDLDSLLPHVREYYEERGVPIVWVEDQDYHDLDVSVLLVSS